MLHWLARAALVASLAVLATPAHAQDPAPLRLAIAGLVHGHVDGFLRGAVARNDVQIVGVFDPDAALRKRYADKYNLPETAFFADLDAMLDRTKPEAVASFTSTRRPPGRRRGGGAAAHRT